MMTGRNLVRIWSIERKDEKGNMFRVVKQLVKRNRDVVGSSCVKDSGRNLEECKRGRSIG